MFFSQLRYTGCAFGCGCSDLNIPKGPWCMEAPIRFGVSKQGNFESNAAKPRACWFENTMMQPESPGLWARNLSWNILRHLFAEWPFLYCMFYFKMFQSPSQWSTSFIIYIAQSQIWFQSWQSVWGDTLWGLGFGTWAYSLHCSLCLPRWRNPSRNIFLGHRALNHNLACHNFCMPCIEYSIKVYS